MPIVDTNNDVALPTWQYVADFTKSPFGFTFKPNGNGTQLGFYVPGNGYLSNENSNYYGVEFIYIVRDLPLAEYTTVELFLDYDGPGDFVVNSFTDGSLDTSYSGTTDGGLVHYITDLAITGNHIEISATSHVKLALRKVIFNGVGSLPNFNDDIGNLFNIPGITEDIIKQVFGVSGEVGTALRNINNLLDNPLFKLYNDNPALYAKATDTLKKLIAIVENPDVYSSATLINVISKALGGAGVSGGVDVGGLINQLFGNLKIVDGAISIGVNEPIIDASSKLSGAIVDGKLHIDISPEFIKESLKGTPLEFLTNIIIDNIEQLKDFVKTIDDIRDSISSIIIPIENGFKNVAAYIRTNSIGDKTRWSSYIKQQLDHISSVFANLKNGKYSTYEQFRDDFDNLLGFKGITETLLNLVGFIPTLLTVVQSGNAPFDRELTYLSNSRAKNAILDLPDLIQAYFRKDITYTQLTQEASKSGLSEEKVVLLLNNFVKLPEIELMQNMYYRGLITKPDVQTTLQTMGYDNNIIAGILELFNLIPATNDLIQFAVKEAFSPDIATKFGQYEDFPIEFGKRAKLQGLSDEYAKMYWAAHWNLPGIGQGFEMLQRRVIDDDTLKLLLKANDVMPFWRDKLIQLSYNPLARVDVKRMYQIGVLNDTEMLNAFKDIGYNDYNANKLVEYTKKSINRVDDIDQDKLKKRTINALENAYSKNKITQQEYVIALQKLNVTVQDIYSSIYLLDIEKDLIATPDKLADNRKRLEKLVSDGLIKGDIDLNDAKSAYIAIGYTAIEADLEIQFLLLEHDIKTKELIAEQIKASYIAHTIDETKAIAMLNAEGFTLVEQGKLIAEWNLIKATKLKKLDEKTVKSLYEKGIIDLTQFAEELSVLGYSDKYIAWIIQLEVQ